MHFPIVLLLLAAAPPGRALAGMEMEAIRAVISQQQDDWNRGDIPAFMNGYSREPGLIFTSGGEVHRGWEEALARSERALRDMAIYGIRTTIPYYLAVLRVPEFRSRRFDTGFVAAHPELVNYSTHRRPWQLATAIAAAVAAHTGH